MIEGSGSGEIVFDGLHADELAVATHGSGDVTVSGVVRRQVINIAGAGRYHAADLATESSEVRVLGTGAVNIDVARLLDVLISGAGSVLYSGSPMVRQRVFGVGTVRRINR